MIKRKARILIGALELLEQGGINNVTTKRMAQQQGVSEPALYRQYKGKLEIIQGIIEEYASFDQQIMNTIIESGMVGKEAILFYVKRFAELYRNYSEITTVMFSMDVYYYEATTKQMMKDIQKRKIEFLKRIIDHGQESGMISKELSPSMVAEMIDGMIFSQIYQWRMNEKEKDVDEKLEEMINYIVKEAE